MPQIACLPLSFRPHLHGDVSLCLHCICSLIYAGVFACVSSVFSSDSWVSSLTEWEVGTTDNQADIFLAKAPKANGLRLSCLPPCFTSKMSSIKILILSSHANSEMNSICKNTWNFPRLLPCTHSLVNFSKGSHHVGSRLTSWLMKGRKPPTPLTWWGRQTVELLAPQPAKLKCTSLWLARRCHLPSAQWSTLRGTRGLVKWKTKWRI